MHDGLDLINDMNGMQLKLTEAVRLMAKYGREYAQAEHDYKVALAQEAIKLRTDGMAVTMIPLVIYGNVAKERLQRDTAEVMWRTAQENVNSIKLKLRLLDAQIGREWGQNN